MANMNHTPTPWKKGSRNLERHSRAILDSHGMLVAEARAATETWEQTEVNANFIVRACNAHEALVKACQAAKERALTPEHERGDVRELLDTLTRALKLACGE